MCIRDRAGISCGLIQDDNGGFTTFIDIQGVEDFHGEMDFKVAGTKKGITAIQMDLKNDGLTMAIIQNALDITYDARCQILDQVMLPCIAEPRPEVSKYAPKKMWIRDRWWTDYNRTSRREWRRSAPWHGGFHTPERRTPSPGRYPAYRHR